MQFMLNEVVVDNENCRDKLNSNRVGFFVRFKSNWGQR